MILGPLDCGKTSVVTQNTLFPSNMNYFISIAKCLKAFEGNSYTKQAHV